MLLLMDSLLQHLDVLVNTFDERYLLDLTYR